MEAQLDRTATVARLVVRAAMADRVTFLAASIAFYAVISIFPLLLLVLAAGSLLGGEAFAESVVEIARGLFTPQAIQVLEEGLASEIGRSGAGIVGVLFLLWAGLKVFRGLDLAFSIVYGEGEHPTFLSTIVHSLVVLVALGAGIAVIIFVQTAGRILELSRTVEMLSPALVFFSLVVLFLPLYFVFPGVTHSPIDVLPGTVLAAFGWTVLGHLFGIYAAHAGTYALFGIVGGVLLLLMWFYFGAIVLLVGAIVNAVLAGRFREDVIEDSPAVERPIGWGDDHRVEGDE